MSSSNGHYDVINEDLLTLFMNIAIENQDIYEGLSPQTLARVLFERSSSSS